MNKYKNAIEAVDTLLHLMCGEEREDGYKPTMEEMSNSMDWLKELVDKETPKKPVVTQDDIFGDYHLVCPNCGQGAIVIATRTDGKLYPRCPFCGQRLMEEDKDERYKNV